MLHETSMEEQLSTSSAHMVWHTATTLVPGSLKDKQEQQLSK